MNGITYYRLKSDYTGDYTKNCALNGSEVDNNFYTLEGRDVKSIAVKDKEIVVTLMNDDTMTAQLNYVEPTDLPISLKNVDFDKLNGVLTLTSTDGTIQKIEGFATNENTDFSVSTDNTLCGDGLRNAPLGVSPAARTGQYKTVKAIVDLAGGEELPKCNNALGDRYITCEDISDYGYLYDYNAVKDIACELKNTEWRIPTKADWDDLLNTIEPCDCDKNHDKADKNKFLGRWAGKLLKSKTMWKDGCCTDSCGGCDCDNCHKKHKCGCEDDCDCGNDTCFDYTDDSCVGTHECEQDCKCESDCSKEHQGIDAFGFRVPPTGYADDGCNFGYFKERSAFWTATTDEINGKTYIKRFQYNKDGVYQDVIANNYHLSLRLVKDYDGKNYFDVENIMDTDYPTLLLPSKTNGHSIWTSCNFACGNVSLNPILPNNGNGITFTRHYFINEWNGFKWVRNEIKQGESVVVAKDRKGKTMIEYRIVDNKLVSVNEMIYDDVIADVKPDIIDIEEKLSTETTERKEADEKLKSNIDAVNGELVKAINTINGGIEEDRTRITALEKGLEDETTARTESDTKLQENIDKVSEKSGSMEEALQKTNETLKAFGEETATAFETINKVITDSINTINGGIATEIEERKSADSVLDERVTKNEEDIKDIKGDLLTSEGTEFNKETGVLTLKSADDSNTIQVAFSFDFGEF